MKKLLYASIVMIGMTINACALYYGVPCAVEGDNLGGVTVQNGETPFPTNSVFPVPLGLRTSPARYLKIAGGKIVQKSAEEKTFADLAIRYKKFTNNVWVELTAEEKHLVDVPAKYKNPDGSEMTPEQKAAVDAAEQQAEQARQAEEQAARESDFTTWSKQMRFVLAVVKPAEMKPEDWTNHLKAEWEKMS